MGFCFFLLPSALSCSNPHPHHQGPQKHGQLESLGKAHIASPLTRFPQCPVILPILSPSSPPGPLGLPPPSHAACLRPPPWSGRALPGRPAEGCQSLPEPSELSDMSDNRYQRGYGFVKLNRPINCPKQTHIMSRVYGLHQGVRGGPCRP